MTEPLLELRDLSFAYGGDQILQGLDLSLNDNDRIAVMGRSGAGKSTLLNILALIQEGCRGGHRFAGRDMHLAEGKVREQLRAAAIGMVFQSHFLIPYLTVQENVALPLQLPHNEGRQKPVDLLAAVGLSHRANHFPNQLSGGEQQRVGFARALIKQPSLLLADEPTGNLDQKTGDDLLNLMLDPNRFQGAVVTVTHNPEVARRFDRIYHLKQGRLEPANT